jgi:hypothetical protein
VIEFIKLKTMKTKTIIILFISAFLLITSACNKSVLPIKGNGELTSETRSMSSFDRIANEGEFDVYIIQDEVFEVTIEAESNLIGSIRTSMNGNTLEIDTKDNLKPSRPMKLYIRTPDVHGVSLSGSGIIDLGVIVTDNLDVSLSGSGEIRGDVEAEDVYLGMSGSGSSSLDLNCNTLETSISGSGDMYFNGIGNAASFNISGSGAVRAYNFELSTCVATISGSGDMFVNVSEQLNVTISGSGSIYYIGHPTIYKNVTGSGNVISKN